jgi:hypothetical protein
MDLLIPIIAGRSHLKKVHISNVNVDHKMRLAFAIDSNVDGSGGCRHNEGWSEANPGGLGVTPGKKTRTEEYPSSSCYTHHTTLY